jgi:hypothetical protein
MRSRASLSLLTLAVLALAPTAAPASSEQDTAGIKQACMDYVEGFYQADIARIETGVHPGLVKRAVSGNKLSDMTRQDLITNSIAYRTKVPPITVEVLDVFEKGNIAVAKITSGFVDYAQLAKIDGKWQVVNVLWAFR